MGLASWQQLAADFTGFADRCATVDDLEELEAELQELDRRLHAAPGADAIAAGESELVLAAAQTCEQARRAACISLRERQQGLGREMAAGQRRQSQLKAYRSSTPGVAARYHDRRH